MALAALLSRDPGVTGAVPEHLTEGGQVLVAPAMRRLHQYLLNRPVSVVLVDVSALPGTTSRLEALRPLRRSFPRTPIILLARPGTDPAVLFDLGRTGLRHLVMVHTDEWGMELRRVLAEAAEDSPPALVSRRLAHYVPPRELHVLRLAMESLHRRPSAEEFAREMGLTRPFLSQCLKATGLPSVGHLLLWSRLFHAAHWLEEPGRSGESISRQLEYSSGSAFRRALKHYTGATPSEIARGGGLSLVLRGFIERVQGADEADGVAVVA